MSIDLFPAPQPAPDGEDSFDSAAAGRDRRVVSGSSELAEWPQEIRLPLTCREPIVNADELRETLAAWRLTRIGDAVLAIAAPTVWLHIERADESAIPAGASKVGGLPDLPDGEPWPAWHEPMAFLVQVDLAATAPFDAEGVLPARGLLSFFYETDGEPLYAELWGKPAPQRAEDYPTRTDPRAWRVCYFPDGSPPLRRRSLPAAGDPSVRYPACAVRFSTQQTIPDPDTPEVVALGMTEAERRAYIALYYDEHSPNRGAWADPGNRLLGHPFTLGSTSSLVECGRASRVVRGDPLGPMSDEPRASIGRAAATRWRLLLQLDSGAAAAMDWAGGGVLHFCIERTALVRREFAGVQLNMQFL